MIGGWSYFGYRPAEGQSDADMGRRRAEVFLDLSRGDATDAYTMERATVVAATRTPRKVRWPDWWEIALAEASAGAAACLRY